MDFEKIGTRLKELRKEKNFSLEKLSEKTGIDTSMLSRYENGKNCKNGMQVYNLVQIATELETSLDYLVFGKGTKVVSYEKHNSNNFGESFSHSISFLAKNFSASINEYVEDFGGYEERKSLVTSFREHGYFNFNDAAEKIINLYINDNYKKIPSFKKFEKDTLNQIANEINKARKVYEEINKADEKKIKELSQKVLK